jgi:hypothetical protein
MNAGGPRSSHESDSGVPAAGQPLQDRGLRKFAFLSDSRTGVKSYVDVLGHA